MARGREDPCGCPRSNHGPSRNGFLILVGLTHPLSLILFPNSPPAFVFFRLLPTGLNFVSCLAFSCSLSFLLCVSLASSLLGCGHETILRDVVFVCAVINAVDSLLVCSLLVSTPRMWMMLRDFVLAPSSRLSSSALLRILQSSYIIRILP